MRYSKYGAMPAVWICITTLALSAPWQEPDLRNTKTRNIQESSVSVVEGMTERMLHHR
jgi:hypothetical protein